MKQIFAAVIADAQARLKKYDIVVLDPELEQKVKTMLTADEGPLPLEEPDE